MMQDRPQLRVVHFVHALNGRTLAEIAGVLAGEMARQGHDATVVAASLTADGSPLPEGVRLVDLGGSSRRTVSSTWRLRRVLGELQPDVVFSHGNGPTRTAVLAMMGLRHSCRLIGIEHNHYSTYRWTMRPLRDVANRVLLRRADVVAGVSPGVTADLADTFPMLRDRLAVVAEPLTRHARLEAMAQETVEQPWPDRRIPVVSSVGHIHARKDHRTLVRAMALVHEVAGPGAARLIIVGNDDTDEARVVRKLIDELDLADHVALIGEQSNPFPFVARSCIFALSSRNEGMPVAILEAMALGIPVVSTDCPAGPAEMLGGGTRGLLVPVGDAEALAAAILRMLDDETMRQGFSTAGRAYAAQFSPADVARQYLQLAIGEGTPRSDEDADAGVPRLS